MKFSLVLAPIVSMAVLAHGDKAASPYSDSNPVSFTHEGVKDVLDVATNSPQADGERAIQGVKTFFKRNPAVLKSILSVANDPKHKQAKDDIANKVIALYSSKGSIDLYENGLKAIDYVYKNPGALDLIQQAGIKAMKDSPTLVDDFFASFEKLTEKDPSIVRKLKDFVIEFSEEQDDAYKKIFEMGLKSALINPGFASHLAVHALLVDKISCAGSKSGSCACNDEYNVEAPVVPEEPNTEEPEVEAEEPEVESEEPEIESPGAPEEPEVEAPEIPEEPEEEAPETPEEPEAPEEPEVEAPELIEEPKEPETERPSYVTEGPKITKESIEVPEVEVEEPEVIEEVEEVTAPEQPIEPEVEAEEPEIEEPRAPEEPEIEESKVPQEPETEELEIPEEPQTEEPEIEESEAPEEPEVEQPIVPEESIIPPQPKQPKTETPSVPETIVEPSPSPVPENTYNVAPPAPEPKNTYAVAAPPLSKPVY